MDLDRAFGEYPLQLGPPGLDQVRRAHDDRAVRLSVRVGMDGAGTHLGLAGAALAAEEHGLLPLQGFDCRRDDVGLGGQHGPLQVECDHGVRGRDVQRLERLPGAIGHQRAVAIQVLLEIRAIHGKRLMVIGLETGSVGGSHLSIHGAASA